MVWVQVTCLGRVGLGWTVGLHLSLWESPLFGILIKLMMEKIINELINCSIKGVDVYRYNNATWLIFTDETRWIIELTDEGTLWYNYKFFNDIMRYVSMNPKEYEGYITGWANDYFFKGVDKTEQRGYNHGNEFEWHTRAVVNKGVKKMGGSNSIRVHNRAVNLTWRIIKTIKPNVVFHGIDNSSMSFVPCGGNITDIWRIVEEGVKNTYPDMIPGDYNWQNEFDPDKVIENGVKV